MHVRIASSSPAALVFAIAFCWFTAIAAIVVWPPSRAIAGAQTGAQRSGKTYTPKVGSAERKALLDALRRPVEKRVGKPVIFRAGSLRVRDGWAFFQGSALNKNGSTLGDEHLWGETTALLRRKGRTWQVLVWGFATDISIMDAAKKRYPSAPRSIYP